MPYTRPVSGAIPLAPGCYCSTEQTQICSTRRAWHPCTYAAHPPRLGKTSPHIAYWSRDPDWGISGLDSSLAFGHVIPDPGHTYSFPKPLTHVGGLTPLLSLGTCLSVAPKREVS